MEKVRAGISRAFAAMVMNLLKPWPEVTAIVNSMTSRNQNRRIIRLQTIHRVKSALMKQRKGTERLGEKCRFDVSSIICIILLIKTEEVKDAD